MDVIRIKASFKAIFTTFGQLLLLSGMLCLMQNFPAYADPNLDLIPDHLLEFSNGFQWADCTKENLAGVWFFTKTQSEDEKVKYSLLGHPSIKKAMRDEENPSTLHFIRDNEGRLTIEVYVAMRDKPGWLARKLDKATKGTFYGVEEYAEAQFPEADEPWDVRSQTLSQWAREAFEIYECQVGSKVFDNCEGKIQLLTFSHQSTKWYKKSKLVQETFQKELNCPAKEMTAQVSTNEMVEPF